MPWRCHGGSPSPPLSSLWTSFPTAGIGPTIAFPSCGASTRSITRTRPSRRPRGSASIRVNSSSPFPFVSPQWRWLALPPRLWCCSRWSSPSRTSWSIVTSTSRYASSARWGASASRRRCTGGIIRSSAPTGTATSEPSFRLGIGCWAPTWATTPRRQSRRAFPASTSGPFRVPWCCPSSGRLPSVPATGGAYWVQPPPSARTAHMLTLYDDVFSPYARKGRIALYEKGLPFERVRALHDDCNRSDFVHVNPRAQGPALVDGDFSLYDSTIIWEYLDDRHPEPAI